MGEVLRYQGRIIQSFFHASSGGMTESSKEVFDEDKPYLTPVISPFASSYRDNKWETTLKTQQLKNSLKLTNDIVSISVIERTSSKRIKTVAVVDNTSNRILINGKEFRNIAGITQMKSTRANIRLTNDNIYISGVGYGHGVGMGQWDALGMAGRGYHYKDIVTFFYRGTSVDKIW